MCGIVGYVGQKAALPILLDGLKRLEYRGYDSAGFALFSGGNFLIKRNAGPVQGLVDLCENLGKEEHLGISHTRWATHGAPTEINAHPHRAGEIVLVHNGIIENYAQIKEHLLQQGAHFSSQTDTEVFAQLIEFHRKLITEKSPKENPEAILMSALKTSMKEVEGHYAILVMSQTVPGKIFGIQNGAPLVAAKLKDGCLIASDIQAIIPYHNEVCFLPLGEIFVIDTNDIHAKNLHFEKIDWSADKVEKDGYESFMMKEIFQQPLVVADSLTGRLPANSKAPFIWDHQKAHEVLWKNAKRLYLIACGTSFHAAMTAKYFFECYVGFYVNELH